MDISGITSSVMNSMVLFFVVIGIATLVPIFFIMRWARHTAGMGGEHKKILQTGVPGQAQILSVQPTTIRINQNPVAIIHLKVQHADGHLYETQVRRLIPLFQVMHFQQGSIVPVMIDREDPSKVVIVI
ncbi:MAG: hypothetical protein NZM00_06890 [Anaerolinea sp.]|nr:hypothetical protein [Anaerolinea sp.]